MPKVVVPEPQALRTCSWGESKSILQGDGEPGGVLEGGKMLGSKRRNLEARKGKSRLEPAYCWKAKKERGKRLLGRKGVNKVSGDRKCAAGSRKRSV